MTKLQQLPQEIWKEIPGYEGLYLVSNLGKVKSLDRICRAGFGSFANKKGRVLTGNPGPYGYPRVSLLKNQIQIGYQIHRLVALAFIPNTENKPQVNHKNGIKTDNNVVNLEWCTVSENILHAFRTGLKKPTLSGLGKFNNSSSKEVFQYSIDGRFVAKYPSMRQAARELSISFQSIWYCLSGKSKTCYGHVWKYY